MHLVCLGPSGIALAFFSNLMELTADSLFILSWYDDIEVSEYPITRHFDSRRARIFERACALVRVMDGK